MQMLYKIIILITLAALGWLLYPFMINLLIKMNAMDVDFASDNLQRMTQNVVFVWILGTILGIISLFIKQKWRYGLLTCTVLAPSLYGLVFVLLN